MADQGDDDGWAVPPPETDGWGWNSSSASTVQYYPDMDNVMHWDDSGALEALEISRERKRARDLGLSLTAPGFRPDLFNDKVDWSSNPRKLSREAAEAWAFIFEAESKAQNRRRGGGKYGRRKLDNQKSGNDGANEQVGQFSPTGWPPLAPEEQQQQQDQPQQQQQQNSRSDPWRNNNRDHHHHHQQQQQQHARSDPRRNNDRNRFQEQQRYGSRENSYNNQPCSSSDWRNSRQNPYRAGVWKPKTTTTTTNTGWAQESSRGESNRNYDNYDNYDKRRW